MYLAGTDRFALAVIVRLAERECRLRASMPFRELACSFRSKSIDPQAGRCPGGYPFWPAGARRRAVVGVAQRGFTRSGNAPLRTCDACSNRILIDNPSPSSAFGLRPKLVQAAYL
ncbi:hypothetical protein MesoLj131a_20110 [Mesorhizobium sp. 131-2-1]|nr:hypothetical protein MesoLj131a_20110 [Mesorhizobium sp. 131-2-1]